LAIMVRLHGVWILNGQFDDDLETSRSQTRTQRVGLAGLPR